MKNLILFAAFALFSHLCIAQTQAIEEAHINKQLADKEITPADATIKIKEFRRIIKESGGYPELPYDTARRVFNLEYILDAPGITKNVLFTRIKEWCAIHYGDVSEVARYESLESGKYIVKGYAPIPYKNSYKGLFGNTNTTTGELKCYHTIAFTVKDGKVKCRIEELKYHYHIASSYIGTTYYPSSDYDVYFSQKFPLIDGNETNMANQFSLIRDTMKELEWIRSGMLKYLLDWQNDYKF